MAVRHAHVPVDERVAHPGGDTSAKLRIELLEDIVDGLVLQHARRKVSALAAGSTPLAVSTRDQAHRTFSLLSTFSSGTSSLLAFFKLRLNAITFTGA